MSGSTVWMKNRLLHFNRVTKSKRCRFIGIASIFQCVGGIYIFLFYQYHNLTKFLTNNNLYTEQSSEFRGIHFHNNCSLFNMEESCKFGIITDLQYANADDGHNYQRTRTRRYRHSLEQLKRAITDWKSQKVDFVLHLGDIIDGVSKRHGMTQADLTLVLETFTTLEKPAYHVWGNHEFYNMKRTDLVKMESFNSSLRANVSSGKTLVNDYDDQVYFHWSPCTGLRLVAIDTYDVSMLGHESTDSRYLQAEDILKNHNPNSDWNSPLNMTSYNQRFLKYNGGVGEKQKQWLESVLTSADANGENVIVLGKFHVLTTFIILLR